MAHGVISATIEIGGRQIVLSADSKKYALGKPCKRDPGHVWPETDQCLRVGSSTGHCAICRSSRGDRWWLLFADWEASGFAGEKLGKLCNKEHKWNGLEVSLRKIGCSHCVECEKERQASDAVKERKRKHAVSYGPLWHQRVRKARMESDPHYAQKRKECNLNSKLRIRGELKEMGLTTKGTVPVTPQCKELTRLNGWLRQPGLAMTVARLVLQQQRAYWKNNPKDKKNFDRQRSAWMSRFRYMINEDMRIKGREKTRRRKYKEREQGYIGHVTAKEFRARRREFEGNCAYCGTHGNPIMEHFLALSKGGSHTISNILPTCNDCNKDKLAQDPETWYRSQPFFSEVRWRKILKSLGKKKKNVRQLSFL